MIKGNSPFGGMGFTYKHAFSPSIDKNVISKCITCVDVLLQIEDDNMAGTARIVLGALNDYVNDMISDGNVNEGVAE